MPIDQPDDLQNLWKELGSNPGPVSIDELRRSAQKVRKTVHWRSILGTGAALTVVASFSYFFFLSRNLWQHVGTALTVVGAAYMIVQLRMRPARVMPEMGATESIRFYRNELERQRDFHRGWWFWSRLVIFLPGPVIFLVSVALTFPQAATFVWLELAAFVFFVSMAVPLNLRLARKYQRQIDRLDALHKS